MSLSLLQCDAAPARDLSCAGLRALYTITYVDLAAPLWQVKGFF
ncbi:hypothetical protein [Roseinatronobacter ekhonensis]|jgi:hypothetical protein|nr:hypothetical protein [Roseibaca ekhonensis]